MTLDEKRKCGSKRNVLRESSVGEIVWVWVLVDKREAARRLRIHPTANL